MSARVYGAPEPHGIMLHHFYEPPETPPGQGALTARDLRKLIEFLGPSRLLPAGQWQERALRNQLEPGNLCLTFDDSLRCQKQIAEPVLREYGLTAFWFIYTSVLEGIPERLELYRFFRVTHFPDIEDFYRSFDTEASRSSHGEKINAALQGFVPSQYLPQHRFYSDSDRRFRFVRDQVLSSFAYDEIMEALFRRFEFDASAASKSLWLERGDLISLAQQGHVIGLHTHTHPTTLAQMPYGKQEQEFETNRRILTDILGVSPTSMAHPCNSYNRDTLEILKKMGVQLGFRANREPLANQSILELPREDHANVMRLMSKG